jgi:hypothetical protein
VSDTPLLAPWLGFYAVTGSAAAALTGLVFVVITLIAGMEGLRNNREGLQTFTTPTVVHFAVAFTVSAAMCAPWRTPHEPGAVLVVAGAVNVVYVGRLLVRTIRMRNYRADWEDWACYTILPLLAYLALVSAGVALLVAPGSAALYAVAAGVIALIVTSIHNAWDIVTFLATGQADALRDDPP